MEVRVHPQSDATSYDRKVRASHVTGVAPLTHHDRTPLELATLCRAKLGKERSYKAPVDQDCLTVGTGHIWILREVLSYAPG